MSWMDWGSRPKKSAATPPPLYLTQGAEQVRYCHTCGRVIGSRKSQSAKASTTEVKYCSDRCKRNKPKAIDRQIEAAFAALLDGREFSLEDAEAKKSDESHPPSAATASPPDKHDKFRYNKQKKIKGDPRIIVACSQVEVLIFGSHDDPEKTFGRKKNRARRGVPDGDVWKSVDMEGSDTDPGSVSSIIQEVKGLKVEDAHDKDSESGESDGEEPPSMTTSGGVSLRIRLPQDKSDVNGSIGGEKGWAEKIEETPEMLQKRRDGQKKAEQKEMVRAAARRAVVFGLEGAAVSEEVKRKADKTAPQSTGRKMCEALMNGSVVEPSYAKGDWSVRWRET